MIMGDPLVNLFDTLEPKSAPLYSCDSWIDGIKYRIPKKMDCPLVNTEKPSAIVNVTLWFEDISVLKVTAYECYAITTTNQKNWFFMGGSFEETKNTKSTVNPSECKHMVNTKNDPQGGKLERIRDGQLGTKKSPEGDWTWPHHIM